MRDLAFLALIIFLVLAVFAVNAVLTMEKRRQKRSIKHARWSVMDFSVAGVTHVEVAKVAATGTVLETREVGQVSDSDPDYEDKLLTLRARAEERKAVLG
jgi:hypothetical protein